MLVLLKSDASLHSADFLISLGFACLDLLNKVVRLENCLVWVHLDNIHVHELLVRKSFARNEVSYINDALVSRVCIVIEENVLSVVITLVNDEQLSTVILARSGVVGLEIVLNCHHRVLFESLNYLLVNLDAVV